MACLVLVCKPCHVTPFLAAVALCFAALCAEGTDINRSPISGGIGARSVVIGAESEVSPQTGIIRRQKGSIEVNLHPDARLQTSSLVKQGEVKAPPAAEPIVPAPQAAPPVPCQPGISDKDPECFPGYSKPRGLLSGPVLWIIVILAFITLLACCITCHIKANELPPKDVEEDIFGDPLLQKEISAEPPVKTSYRDQRAKKKATPPSSARPSNASATAALVATTTAATAEQSPATTPVRKGYKSERAGKKAAGAGSSQPSGAAHNPGAALEESAAIRIQAAQRGNQGRKEVEEKRAQAASNPPVRKAYGADRKNKKTAAAGASQAADAGGEASATSEAAPAVAASPAGASSSTQGTAEDDRSVPAKPERTKNAYQLERERRRAERAGEVAAPSNASGNAPEASELRSSSPAAAEAEAEPQGGPVKEPQERTKRYGAERAAKKAQKDESQP